MSDWPVIIPDPTLEMEFIGTTTLAAPAASLSVSAPSPAVGNSYLTFEAVAYIIKDGSGGIIAARLNNDSGANYNYGGLGQTGTPGFVAHANIVNDTSFKVAYTAQLASGAGIYYLQLSKPTTGERASAIVHSGMATGAAGGAENFAGPADWANTTELITRLDLISLTANMDTGTRLSLAGGRAA